MTNSAQAQPATSIQISPTQGNLFTDYSVKVSGHGLHETGAVEIANNVGTIDIHSMHLSTFIQKRIPWGSMTLFQGMAFDPTHFYLYWIYCNVQKKVSGFYYESPYSQEGFSDVIIGSCDSTTDKTSTLISLPAVELPMPKGVPGFEIIGDQIHLPASGVGTVAIQNRFHAERENFNFIPFAAVDCMKCGTPRTRNEAGWYELHSLFFNELKGRACFGIFYLYADQKYPIDLEYTLCLPDLDRSLDYASFEASWKKTTNAEFIEKLKWE